MADGTIEIITGHECRRRWSTAKKLRIVAESEEPGARVKAVAVRHDVYPSLVFHWRRQSREGRLSTAGSAGFVPVRLLASAEQAASSPPPAAAEAPAASAPAETARRKPLPASLPRDVVEHAAPCACPRCGGKLHALGEDVTEVLDYVPGAFRVIRHVRPKLSCRACESIAQAPAPSLPIRRGLAGQSRPPLSRDRRHSLRRLERRADVG